MHGSDMRERLERHLRTCDAGVSVTSWRPLEGGRSARTVRVGVDGAGESGDCVLHIEPAAGPLAGFSTAAGQYRVLELLRETNVRAPRPRWLCTDPDVLGRPFFLTEFVPGDVPTPWRPEGRRALARHEPGGALARAFVERLVEIHSVSVDGLPGGPPGQPYAQRERQRWTDVVQRSPVFADDPVLRYADAWLATRALATGSTGLVHGDYRFGNLVIDGDDVAAVLDWELAEVGDPVYDVGTVCSPPMRTGGLAAGLWENEDLVAHYEDRRGAPVDRSAVDYYRVLSVYKIASLWVNASLPYTAGDDDLAALRAGFSVLEARPMIAETLGLAAPAPAGDPAVAVSPATRAAATVRAALADDVLPDLSEGDVREQLRAVLAILRAQPRDASSDRCEALADAVAELAAEAQGSSAGRGVGPAATADAPARLARLVRAVMARPAVAADIAHPLHARLREVVAMAAAPDLGRWP